MHRNTFLVTIFLAILASLLIGFHAGRGLKNTPPQATLTPTPAPAAVQTFTSNVCGITFQYPSALSKLDGASGSAIFTDPANEGNSVAVVCQEDIPRPPLTAERIETLAVALATGSASISANLYHEVSAQNGSPIDQLIFTHPTTGLDVFIAGFGEIYNQILTSLRILN